MGDKPGPSLRPWQYAALEAWHAVNRRGIVEVVTGAGKTRLALAAVQEWLAQSTGGRVLVIVPTSALQDQWLIEISEFLGIEQSSIGSWPGNNDSAAQIHVLIVNTARTIAPRLGSNSVTFLVADECHRYATGQNLRAIDIDATLTLGLTATAERQYDDGLYDILVPTIGPIFFQYSISDARRDGIIAPFHLVNLEVPLLEPEQEAYAAATRQLVRAIAVADSETIKRISLRRAAIAKGAKMRIPATVALMERLRGKRSLIFHEDILSAEVLLKLLEERGHSVAAYHSQMGSALRRDNLRSFRDGVVDVLIACRALDEGVDVPDAECAIIAAASASRRQRIQRLGRVLRTSQNKGMATVYTVYATDSENERLRNEQAALTDVADVRWMAMNARDHA